MAYITKINGKDVKDTKASQDIADLKSAFDGMTTATENDEGMALKAKTVSGGKVTEWEFGEAGGGLTATAANLLLTILDEGVYGSDQTDNIELLRKALMDIAPVSITAVLDSIPLVGMYYSELEFTVTAVFDDASTMIVDNYRILTAGSVTSGSNTVTVAYSGITTDVTFTASEQTTYSITQTLTDVTSSNNAHLIIANERFATELSVDEDHYISSYSVTMGGTDITSTAYNNGNIVIAEVTGDVVIVAVASAYVYLDPLIQLRPFTNEGDSVTRLYTDEYVTQANPANINYIHVGQVTEYPAKSDCTLTWKITNTSDSAIALGHLGFGMISGDQDQYLNNNAIAYWQKIDNAGHSLDPGASLDGTYTLKAGWQLILTTTINDNDALSCLLRGDYVAETFSDYSLLYTITNDATSYPQIGNYRTLKFYSDNETTEIISVNGWPRQVASNVGPVHYSTVFHVTYDAEISKTQGRMGKTAIGYIDNVNASVCNYASLAKKQPYSRGCNVWMHGEIKATSSGMYLVITGLPNNSSVTLEVYGKEVAA